MQDNSSQKRTKICMAITKGDWGGAQEYVYTLATTLPKDKYEVVVISGQGEALKKRLADKNIRTHVLSHLKRDISLFSEITSFFTLIRIIIKERPDILHLNSTKMGGLGAVAGRLTGVPKIIFTVHGWAFNEDRFILNRIIIKFLSWITIILCHKIIAVSNKTKKDIGKLPLVKNKIVVVHNGIEDFDLLPKVEARKELRERVRLSETTPIVIGTISELHKNKGLDFLIDACIRLSYEASVYIIGEGEEKEKLEEKIKGYGLEHKVFLVGKIENAKKYLKAFDIFTLTSRTEALPYSILEAGLAECAVVATAVGGIPEIINHGINGILVHKNAIQIEETLRRLVENKEEREVLGRSLRKTVLNNFSFAKMLEETIKVYS